MHIVYNLDYLLEARSWENFNKTMKKQMCIVFVRLVVHTNKKRQFTITILRVADTMPANFLTDAYNTFTAFSFVWLFSLAFIFSHQ